MKDMSKSYFSNCAHIISSTYLVVLVRRDRNERCFGEHMSAEGGVFGAEAVIFIRLYNMDPRLVFMHRVQNDLKERTEDRRLVRAVFRKAFFSEGWIDCMTLFDVKNK